MDYKNEQEAMFQELEVRDQQAKVAWVAEFLRAAKDRGYTIDAVLAVLDEPGMTNSKAVSRILGIKESQ